MRLQSDAHKKTYIPPKLNKLTQEQATLVLLGHTSCGDQGAKDLLDVLYPFRENYGNHDVPVVSQEGKPAQIMASTSWLIHRALTAFQSTREDFWRFVRG